MNVTYHVRRREKAITDPAEMLEVLRAGSYMTLAMCKDNEPYLATLNYVLDEAKRCLYFHCAAKGKKLEYWAANPIVWGQVLEDRGYLAGECSYAYRTVQFRGRVEYFAGREEKYAALRMMIDRLEPQPAVVRKEMLENNPLDKVIVGCIHIEDMSGKISPPPKK